MTRTILLADDSVTIQKVVELTFLDEDFRVVAFGDGAEAIARLQEVRPDVVIADVHMPGADGYQVAEAVRDQLPGVPVLLLVGTFEVFDVARSQGAGAAGHLKKPFDSQELMRRVNELAASPAAQPLSGWTAPVTPQPAAVAPPEAPSEEPAPALYEPEAPVFEPEPVAFEPAGPAAFEPEPEPVPAPTAVPAPSWTVSTPAPAAAAAAGAGAGLTDEDVERIAHRVAELVADKIVREVAWEVVPDLAEVLLKARIRELEASVE